nr:Chain P, CA/p2 substrate peptide [Human immunodeficiency virus 1]4FAF_D Chain D, substrate CA/p2 peptide [synthetic construct]
RVLFEAM